jgi:hypothetical protein
MRRSRCTKPTRLIAGLLTGLLFAILAVPLIAQPVGDTPARGSLGYDKAHEMTLNGTIKEVVSQHVPGSPMGLHLIVAGAQGTVDAHIGPCMSKETQEALREGVPVQIVGSMATFHGKSYLLARQLTFSGRQITVRSESGLLRMGTPHARSKADNGGAR